MDIKLDVITLKDPCTACVIIGDVVKDMLNKFKKELMNDGINLEINYIELDDIKNAHSIQGLEVEKFPAIIFDNEQITAGNIPDIEYIKSMIKWGTKNE